MLTERIKLNLLFKHSSLISNFAVTLGYLNPALNNPALDVILTCNEDVSKMLPAVLVDYFLTFEWGLHLVAAAEFMVASDTYFKKIQSPSGISLIFWVTFASVIKR